MKNNKSMDKNRWRYVLSSLGTSHGRWRYARRALLLLFIWCLVMIATLQFRNAAESDNSLSSDEGGKGQSAGWPYRFRFEAGSSLSRYLFQRLPKDTTTSIGGAMPATTTTKTKEYYDLEITGGGNSLGIGDSRISRDKNHDKVPLEPLIDKRTRRTEDELVREIESRLPSLPLAYWLKTSSRMENLMEKSGKKTSNNDKAKRKSCVPRFPSIYDLEFNNIYWQTLRTSNGTFQLFGAYYDVRNLTRISPAVRIVGMIDRIEPSVRTYCQMWFDGDSEPGIVETLEYKYVWHSKWGNYKQGIYQPYVIACSVPKSHQGRGPPASVSIVEKSCDTARNNLRVIYNKPETKRGFAVCVKGLDFLHDDLSVRLIEWIELISLLGADKIFFYQLQIHPNVSKVLDYYEKLGKIEVTPVTLPGGQPNIPAFQHMYLTKKTNNKRQNELIPYNDCLYKHMYEYEYIALLDVDEVIMPLKDSTWPELMKRILPKALAIRNETRASYNVRNVYFLDDLLHSHGYYDDIPKYMHMLQHVYRSKNFTKPNQYVKCFHNPERVITLHNHFPLACLGAGCTSYPIETEDAQLQHYRADCVKSLKKTCTQYRENSVTDTTIWRYKDQLVERVTDALRKLGFFGSKNHLT